MTNHPFVPLRHRAVRLLWSAAVVSDIGTWVQLIVVGSLVAAKTGSAVQTGLVALATFAPQSIASPVGGLLADRFDRRKVFAAALMVQALVTTALAVTLGVGVREPAVLILLILLASAAGATGAPSYAAMLPDLVPPEELMAMVSLGVYSWNSGRIIGPLLGTALVLVVGPAWTIGFNAASFVVLALAVAMVRRTFRPTRSDGTIFDRLVGGWRTLRSTPGCFHGVALLVLYNLTIVPFIGLIPIYLRAGYGGGTGMAGTVASAQGAGAIIGGIIVSVLAHRHPRSLLIGRLIVLLGVRARSVRSCTERGVGRRRIGAARRCRRGILHRLIGDHPARRTTGQPRSCDVDHAGGNGSLVRRRPAVHRFDRRCHQPAPRLWRRGDLAAGRLRFVDPAVASLAHRGRRRPPTRCRDGLTRRSRGGPNQRACGVNSTTRLRAASGRDLQAPMPRGWPCRTPQ